MSPSIEVSLSAIPAHILSELDLRRAHQERTNKSMRKAVRIELACEITYIGAEPTTDGGWHSTKAIGPRHAYLRIRIPVLLVDLYWRLRGIGV